MGITGKMKVTIPELYKGLRKVSTHDSPAIPTEARTGNISIKANGISSAQDERQFMGGDLATISSTDMEHRLPFAAAVLGNKLHTVSAIEPRTQYVPGTLDLTSTHSKSFLDFDL